MSDKGEASNEQKIGTGVNNESNIAESHAQPPQQSQQQNDNLSTTGEEASASTSTSSISASPAKVAPTVTPSTNPASSPSIIQPGSTPASTTTSIPNLTTASIAASPRPPQSISPRPAQPSPMQAPQPRLPTASSQPTSMTLLDNLTAQLSPDRKEKFLELFRKLQNNAVSVPDFLSQARMLLDQQQYQQIENLKNKPAQQQQQQLPRNVPLRPPTIQPQQQIPHLQPISSSQVRAEDAQRAMMPGFINAQQGKKSKAAGATDIPKSLPMFRPGNAAQVTPQLTLQQQQYLQQQQMKQHLLQQHLMQQQRLQMQSQSTNTTKQSKKAAAQQQQASPILTTTPTTTTAKQQQQQQKQQQQQTDIIEDDQQKAENLVEVSNQPTISQDFMNTDMLRDRLKKYTSSHQLELEPDVITLIALATEKRLERLIQHMIEAFKHRTESQTFTQPPIDEKTGHHPFKIVDVQDIKKQLLAVERVEREEERKRKEMILEKERKALLGEDGGHDGGGDGAHGQGVGGSEDGERPKKKKKKEMGPSVSARYMSDDVRNKTTNETALMIAGGVMKSWMLTGMNSSTGLPSSSSFSSSSNRDKLSPAPISRQNSNNPAAIKSENTADNTNTLSSPTPSPSNASMSTANDTSIQQEDQSQQQPQQPQQPRGRGRPRRRKSGSGPDGGAGKKMKAFPRPVGDGGFFLPPSTIGRPHRLGEHATRKITVRDAVFVLEEEYENNMFNARRTLLKVYSNHLN